MESELQSIDTKKIFCDIPVRIMFSLSSGEGAISGRQRARHDVGEETAHHRLEAGATARVSGEGNFHVDCC